MQKRHTDAYRRPNDCDNIRQSKTDIVSSGKKMQKTDFLHSIKVHFYVLGQSIYTPIFVVMTNMNLRDTNKQQQQQKMSMHFNMNCRHCKLFSSVCMLNAVVSLIIIDDSKQNCKQHKYVAILHEKTKNRLKMLQ